MFKIFRVHSGAMIESNNSFYHLKIENWNEFINDDKLYASIEERLPVAEKVTNVLHMLQSELLPPIDRQEIWGSGVTYLRSRQARKEEAVEVSGATFYDRVYDAERPELFFKASAQRAVGSGEKVNIRKDSTWNVPEPELTLLITSNAKIVGYTVGNDMSSRSIEGENPLYLPQAKTYEKCVALGPCITVTKQPLRPDTSISMEIKRRGNTVYSESIEIGQMKRKHAELVDYLFRELEFPYGCFLLTGTGMVPPKEFTLSSGDEINITIDSIGTLVNTVA